MSVSSTIAILSSTVLSSHNKYKRLNINDINAENYKDYIDSSDFEIRAKVAELDYGLLELVDDPHWYVRKQVAKQGYGLGLLVDDPDEDVRVEVAKHGFGLDILKNDESRYVQAEAKRQLAKRKRN